MSPQDGKPSVLDQFVSPENPGDLISKFLDEGMTGPYFLSGTDKSNGIYLRSAEFPHEGVPKRNVPEGFEDSQVSVSNFGNSKGPSFFSQWNNLGSVYFRGPEEGDGMSNSSRAFFLSSSDMARVNPIEYALTSAALKGQNVSVTDNGSFVLSQADSKSQISGSVVLGESNQKNQKNQNPPTLSSANVEVSRTRSRRGQHTLADEEYEDNSLPTSTKRARLGKEKEIEKDKGPVLDPATHPCKGIRAAQAAAERAGQESLEELYGHGYQFGSNHPGRDPTWPVADANSNVVLSRNDFLHCSYEGYDAYIESIRRLRGKLTAAEEREVKKQRRLIKNRESAHVSRRRKAEYVTELERQLIKVSEEKELLERKLKVLQQSEAALALQKCQSSGEKTSSLKELLEELANRGLLTSFLKKRGAS